MSHTKGPWVVGPVDDTVVTHMGKDGIRYEVAAVDGDYNDPDTWPIMEANARLIAAAPDLLEAIQELSQISDGIYVHMSEGENALMRNAWAKVDAAIAKATQS